MSEYDQTCRWKTWCMVSLIIAVVACGLHLFSLQWFFKVQKLQDQLDESRLILMELRGLQFQTKADYKTLLELIGQAKSLDGLKRDAIKLLDPNAPPDDKTSPFDLFKLPKADSPQEALEMLASAYHRGDYEAIRNLSPKKTRRLLDQMMAIGRDQAWAFEDLNDALETRFGKEARLPMIGDETLYSPSSLMSTDKARKYVLLESKVVDDKHEELKVRVTRTINPSTGETDMVVMEIVAVKEDSGWKISEENIEGQEKMSEAKTEEVWKFMRKHVDGSRRVAEDLKRGQYANRKEALDAWRKLTK